MRFTSSSCRKKPESGQVAKALHRNGRMLECWNALSGVIDTMPQNGLSQQKFRKVNHSRAELFEIVAELAALLVV